MIDEAPVAPVPSSLARNPRDTPIRHLTISPRRLAVGPALMPCDFPDRGRVISGTRANLIEAPDPGAPHETKTMIFEETGLAGAFVIDLQKRGDERGFFARVFCEHEFAEHGLATGFVQVNNSLSADKGTLRGMHYQLAPKAEVKVVRCIRGALFDCIIDLREGSSTFGHHFGVELTAENRRMLYVPKGFAHGFLTLEDDTEAFYFVDEFYAPTLERGIRWDDPRFGIEWPTKPSIVSEKDTAHPAFDPEFHLRA